MKRLGLTAITLSLLSSIFFFSSASAAPGDLDATFGQHGRVNITSPIPGISVIRQRFIEQSDGKIVIVGVAGTLSPSGTFTSQDMAVVRLNADGTPDTTFSGDGYMTIDFSGGQDLGFGVAQQSDGKLIVVGSVSGGLCGGTCFGAARVNTDGTLDTTFNGTGKIMITAANSASATSVIVQSGGGIVIGGYSFVGGLTLVRLTSSGVLDTTFGSSGVTSFAIAPQTVMTRMIAQADGKIVAVGGTPSSASTAMHAMVAVRTDSNGNPDVSFNLTGLLSTPCLGYCQYSSVAQQADGKLVFSGITSLAGTGSPELQPVDSFLERRNLSDGSLDTSFGQSGRTTTLFANAYGRPLHKSEAAYDEVIDANGNIVVLGHTLVRSYNNSGLASLVDIDTAMTRYTPSGTLDTTFGSQGYRVMPSGIPQGGNVYGISWGNVALMTDGRVLVLGSGSRTDQTGTVAIETSIAVARLSTGAPDAGTFGISLQSSVTENAGATTVLVRRHGGASGAVGVSYSTASGTAVAGTDFTAVSGTLTWADGDTSSRLVSIPILSDAAVEASDETFQFTLSNPTGGAGFASDTATLRILRDDVAPANTVSFSQASVSATEGAGSVATLTVVRTGTAPITVSYNTAPYLAASGAPLFAQSPADYTETGGVLVWGAGDTAPKTITIPIGNDAVFEQPESFNVRLLLSGGGAVVVGDLATITINDDETPPVIATAAAVSVSESQTTVSLTVTRTGSTAQPVSVSYATANGTALAGSDFAATNGTLTWQPSDPDSKTISIPLLPDTTYEGNETFTMTLSAPTAGATLGTATATVTITDDDPQPAPPKSGGGGRIDLSLLMLCVLLGVLQRSTLRRRSIS